MPPCKGPDVSHLFPSDTALSAAGGAASAQVVRGAIQKADEGEGGDDVGHEHGGRGARQTCMREGEPFASAGGVMDPVRGFGCRGGLGLVN